jgi:hypothetical protein
MAKTAIFQMATIEDVKNYMSERYERWLDYAKYQCSRAGIPDEAADVLNEVMCAYLARPHDRLTALYSEKGNRDTRLLDGYILRSIQTNVWKATSNYQYRYHRDKYYTKRYGLPVPVEYVSELPEDAEDVDADAARQKKERETYRRFSRFCKRLNLDPPAIKIFHFRFFEHRKWAEWPGNESRYILTKLYRRAKEIIFHELNIGSGDKTNE